MANYTEKELLTVVKSYSRANPLALDSTALWDTKQEAENYAKQPNAYAGQVITAKVDGKYKAFVLQGENGNCTLEAVGADPSALKQYVIVGTSGTEQNGLKYLKMYLLLLQISRRELQNLKEIST